MAKTELKSGLADLKDPHILIAFHPGRRMTNGNMLISDLNVFHCV